VLVFIVTFYLFENQLVLLLSVRVMLQHAKVSWLCVDDLRLTFTVIGCICMYLCIMSVNTRAFLSVIPVYWFELLFISPRTYRYLYSFIRLRPVRKNCTFYNRNTNNSYYFIIVVIGNTLLRYTNNNLADSHTYRY
jgi:hypothetical protein